MPTTCFVEKAINATFNKKPGSCQIWRLEKKESGKRFALYRWNDGKVDIKCMEGDGRQGDLKIFEEKPLTPPVENAGVEAEIKDLAKKHFNIEDVEFKYAKGLILIK